ncbi:MAG: aspartate aminotransferase family protein [Elusimicrobia bacterium]|nr:aspartate aminotransferase family protein [Elusimicrobiota bacterium]
MPAPTNAPAQAFRYAPGPKCKALCAEESRHIAPGLQTIALYSQIALESGHGRHLRDLDGKEYLDFVAGIGVASLGYSHPEYVRIVSEQLSRIHVGSFTTPHRANFVKSLAAVTPKGLDRIQLYSSGAEAVEAAVRLAKSRTKKYELMGFWGGFHGKTGGILPVLGDSFKHELGPLMPGLYLTPYPNRDHCPFGTKGEHDCAAHCLDFMRETIKRSTAGALAAVICEPIQGTAGNVIPAQGWLKGLRALTKELGALLISDEMITGFGRTGKFWGCDDESVVPDIMTVGKGLGGGFPVSGVITSTEIAQSKPWGNPSGSSSSYGGNPFASAACDAALQIILKEKLVENSRKMGELLLARLAELKDRSPLIGLVRGRGLMIGVELINPKTRKPLEGALCRELFEECLTRGLLTMSYNPMLRINPPLTITQSEVEHGVSVFADALGALAGRHGLA